MMEKDLVRLFKCRWKEVERIEGSELKDTSPAVKLYELAGVFRMGKRLGFASEKGVKYKDIEKIQHRWMKLKGKR